MTALAVSIGTAKPTPTLPPEPAVAIWELIPITRPAASISGPPELPGLIAASVWITLSIEKPLGAVIRRCLADTTPVVSVRSSPNGLPIATVGSPTCTDAESPSSSGCRSSPSGSTVEQREVGVLVAGRPRAPARVRWSENVTRMSVAPATTCALVSRWPSRSITKPEPVDDVGRALREVERRRLPPAASARG